MSININFESLDREQREKVEACAVRNCAGCTAYLGQTELGEHTYFWHYGASEGYVVLPLGEEHPHYDYDSGNITVGGREFTTDGVEILPPPFEYLVHFNIRKWHQIYREHVAEHGPFKSEEEESNFLSCCECNAHSVPPKRVAKTLNLASDQPVAWIGHFYLKPWELTEELFSAAVALTLLRPNGDRIVVI